MPVIEHDMVLHEKKGEEILRCQSVHMWYIYLGFRINYSISSTLGAPWC